MSKLAMYFKKLIFIFTFLFFNHLYSEEIIIQWNLRVVYDDFTFTDNSKYIIINQEGQWTDSIGNYGASECKGLIKRNDKQNTKAILDIFEPIEFPTARTVSFWSADSIDTNISGAEVAIPIMKKLAVNPEIE